MQPRLFEEFTECIKMDLAVRIICRTLNEDEIPCPAKYKKEVLKTNYVWDSGKGLWTSSTVSGILKNPVYTGADCDSETWKDRLIKLKYQKGNSPGRNGAGAGCT